MRTFPRWSDRRVLATLLAALGLVSSTNGRIAALEATRAESGAPAPPETSPYRRTGHLENGAAVGKTEMPPGALVVIPLLSRLPVLPPRPARRSREEPRLIMEWPDGAPLPESRTGGELEQKVETREEARPEGARLSTGESFHVARNTAVPTPSGWSSVTNEPNVGSLGRTVFQTGNFYTGVSSDNGSTFRYVSMDSLPRSPFPFTAGACCDQRVAQDRSRNLLLWYVQYLATGPGSGDAGAGRLAVASSETDLAAGRWWLHDFTPEQFGYPRVGHWLDYPYLEVSSNYLYLQTSVCKTVDQLCYDRVTARIPLANLASNTPFTMTVINNNIGLPVKGATDTMYFGYGSTRLDIYKWPESDATPSYMLVDSLGPWNFSLNCPGPDGLNPCGPPNQATTTGWIRGGELGFMWHSGAIPPSRPYPFVRVAIVDAARLKPYNPYGSDVVLSQPDIFSTTHAWMYPVLDVNARGHLGGSIRSWGGAVYPGIHAIIRDDLSPDPAVAGWEIKLVERGTSGAPGRMGDFSGANVHAGYPNTWLGVGHVLNGGNANANTTPRNFWLMRLRDLPGAHVTLGASPPVLESAGSGTFTVTLTTTTGAVTDVPVSVTYATSGGSASPGSDYTPVSGTLSWPVGTTSGSTASFAVPILDDSLDEPPETIVVTLSSPVGATGDEVVRTLTVLDDDPKAISVGDSAVVEGNTGTATLSFPVSLSNPSGLPVRASFVTADGTASAGSDYQTANGTVEVPAGAQRTTVAVTVLGDTTPETSETLLLRLSGPVNGTLARPEGTGLVIDDDTPLGFHTLSPCRLADTRQSTGPALAAGETRVFPVAGRCGVPSDARAVALNVTTVASLAPGHLSLHPAGTPTPSTSSLNFGANQTRPNNAVVTLGIDGALAVSAGQATGTVHVLIDVSGYFR